MSENQSQTQSKIMERIAFIGVIVFALGMSYAIYITQQTVNAIEAGHYQNSNVVSADINATSSDAENQQPAEPASGQ
jgi:L-rhamnose isomerase